MDIREALASAIETVETPDTPSEVLAQPAAEVAQDSQPQAPESSRTRDETGRFVKSQATDAQAPSAAQPQDQQQSLPLEAAPQPPAINRPSTWRKEYWPLYDKLATGQALTADEAKKIADYTNERESQFKTGVSTYKAEAESARELQTAMAPFMPELQKYGIAPGQWISNLGRAHHTLATGSPQDKLVMFQRLAQEYGVPLNGFADGQVPQVDPNVQMLHQRLAQFENQFNGFKTAQEQAQLKQVGEMVEEFKSAPGREHFDAVKAQMARLLETGFAQDLNDAYDKAVRLDADVWSQIQQQKLAQSAQQAQAVAAKAKAAAVSPRSASPSSQGDKAPKGLRAALEQSVEAALGGGRV